MQVRTYVAAFANHSTAVVAGRTPMHVAALYELHELDDVLLQAEASVQSTTDKSGFTVKRIKHLRRRRTTQFQLHFC